MALVSHRHTIPGLLAPLVVLALFPSPAEGQALTNGSFENGIAGWATGGLARTAAVTAANFNPSLGLTMPDGTYGAILSTYSTSTTDSRPDLDGNGTLEAHVTTLSQTFSVASAPVNLSLSWLVLTSEGSRAAAYDDVFSIELSSAPLLRRSSYKPGGGSPWTDAPPSNGTSYVLRTSGGSAAPAAVAGSTFSNGRGSSFTPLCVTISQPGTYTLKFTVADQGDRNNNSALLVDHVELPSSCVATPFAITDTSGANLESKAGGLVFTPYANREVVVSDDGFVTAFISNANLTGDNPNAVDQVFTYSGGVFRRLTAFANGTVGRPSITRNGRFLSFAGTGITTGNTDGNSEIYRFDRDTSTLTQVTSTSVCTNAAPSISDDTNGNSIFFQTTCNLANSNSNGNQEIARWIGGSTFYVTNGSTAPCASRDPYAAWGTPTTAVFVSTCGFTGAANADANPEIFRWVGTSTPGTVTRITNTTAPAANDVPSITADAAYASFLSSGNPAGANADGSLEVFRWQASNASFTQATNDASGFVAYTWARIGGSNANLIATERINVLSGSFETSLLTVGGGESVLLTSSDFTMPALAAGASPPALVLQSSSNLRGENPDGNLEIWASANAVGRIRTYTRTLPPLAITDCAGYSQICECTSPRTTTDDLVITDSGTVGSMAVSLVVTHTYVGDLIFRLTHVETGTTVTLLHRPGVPDPNPSAQCGCSNDNINAVFDDTAATSAENQCASSTPTINGRFLPYTPLAAFSGQPLAGTWRLSAVEMAGQDTGTISSWGLTVTVQ